MEQVDRRNVLLSVSTLLGGLAFLDNAQASESFLKQSGGCTFHVERSVRCAISF